MRTHAKHYHAHVNSFSKAQKKKNSKSINIKFEKLYLLYSQFLKMLIQLENNMLNTVLLILCSHI